MIEINVCIGTSCHLNGSYNVIQTFRQQLEERSLHNKINLKSAFCMKECQNKGVSVNVDGECYQINPMEAVEFFQSTILKKLEKCQ